MYILKKKGKNKAIKEVVGCNREYEVGGCKKDYEIELCGN